VPPHPARESDSGTEEYRPHQFAAWDHLSFAAIANAVTEAFIRFYIEDAEQRRQEMLSFVDQEMDRVSASVLLKRERLEGMKTEQIDPKSVLQVEIQETELARDEKLLMQLVESRHKLRTEMHRGRSGIQLLRRASP
jgi:hypothetical protein